MQRKYRIRHIISSLLKASYLLLVINTVGVYGQLVDNFDDRELTNPQWQGDITNFIVNQNGQLQLLATTAGTSKIYSKFKKPQDSISLEFYNKMQFAPSADNNQIIYLLMDRPDELSGNGYYISIGENGSNDALKFFKTVNGTSTLLGSGSLGAMGADPADVRVKIKITLDGTWDVNVDYAGGNAFVEDAMFVEDIAWLPDSLYFGMMAKYTVSRIDKFFMDDIKIKTIEPDLIPPSIVNVTYIPTNKIKIDYSEPIEVLSATSINNYTLNPGSIKPTNIVIDGSQSVILTFANGLSSGIDYTINANAIKDRVGNIGVSTGTFIFAEKAVKGDLIISEVLTDPYVGGEDFVEIYNKSNKTIQLQGLIIKNLSKNESKSIINEAILKPKSYIAISKNVDFLISTYVPKSDANFTTETLPSLNVADAFIAIIENGVVLDSFQYREEFHFGLLDETKGISLERIDLNGSSNDPNNWHSAASTVLYATPGYINSNNISSSMPNTGEVITIDNSLITPNGDGLMDFANLQFSLPKSGFLATIKVFNIEGMFLFDLGNNIIVPTEGSVKWDGLDNENNTLPMGMYILATRLFHPDGDIITSKNVISIADTK